MRGRPSKCSFCWGKGVVVMIETTIEIVLVAIGIFSGVVVYCLARRGQSDLWERTIPVASVAPKTDCPPRAPTRGFDPSRATAYGSEPRSAGGKGTR